ncbi:MAG: MFS transporter [Bacillota bacterium]
MQDQTPANGFRTFVTVWVTQSVSMIGSMLAFFSLTIWLTTVLYPLEEQKPQLGVALSAMSLAFMLPGIFMAPIAGAFVDRHDRRKTMLVADLIMALLAGILTVLISTKLLTLWTLVPLMAALSAVNAFHSAAFDTSYVMLVPNRLLPRANGMMQTSISFAQFLAPMLAAVIIALPGMGREGSLGALSALFGRVADGTALVTGLEALTYALAAVVLIFIRIPSPRRSDLAPAGKPKKSLWADVREGADYVFRRPPLLWLLATFTVANFCLSTMNVLMPMIVKFNLADSREVLGLSVDQAMGRLGSLAGVGGLIGGLLISTWGGLKSRRVLGVVVPMVVTGAAQMLYGFSPAFYLTAAMAFLIQFTMPLTNAHSQSIWQAQTPKEMQGRVFSVRRIIAWVSNPVAATLAGIMGGYLDPGMVVGVMGAIFATFATVQLFNPNLMRVEDKKHLDDMAAVPGGVARSAP